MDVTKRGFAVIMRADGTVPFDDDVHPDHRATMIAHLVESGHHVHVDPETKVVTIHSGPMRDGG